MDTHNPITHYLTNLGVCLQITNIIVEVVNKQIVFEGHSEVDSFNGQLKNVNKKLFCDRICLFPMFPSFVSLHIFCLLFQDCRLLVFSSSFFRLTFQKPSFLPSSDLNIDLISFLQSSHLLFHTSFVSSHLRYPNLRSSEKTGTPPLLYTLHSIDIVRGNDVDLSSAAVVSSLKRADKSNM